MLRAIPDAFPLSSNISHTLPSNIVSSNTVNSLISNPALPTVLLLSLLVTYLIIIYPLLLSPHSHIPGPIPAHLTSLYLSLFDLFSLTRNRTIARWHKLYGPVVRIGPNEVAVADPQAFREIYQGKSRYDKGRYFKRFALHGADCLFSITDYKTHQARRRTVAGIYTKTAVARHADGFVRERVSALVHEVAKTAEWEGGHVDFLLLFACFTLDNITRYLYGETNGTRHVEGIDSRHLIRAKQQAQVWVVWSVNLPWFYGSWVSKKVMPKGYTESLSVHGEEVEFSTRLMEREEAAAAAGMSVYKTMRDNEGTEKGEIASELLDHLVAGQETTATALTSLMWRLARERKWQTRLREEVEEMERGEDGLGVPRYAQLEQGKVLDALIKETLRFHPVSSGRLERVVPEGGRTYCGVFVPQGTVVTGQLLALHKNEAVFPEPDIWRPQRWLDATEEEFVEMEKSWVPFGYGSRICIGRHLAMLEIKTAIAGLVTQFEVDVDQRCTDESMETLDTLVAVPKGLKCELVVKTLQERAGC